jgi:hypothetical protein
MVVWICRKYGSGCGSFRQQPSSSERSPAPLNGEISDWARNVHEAL